MLILELLIVHHLQVKFWWLISSHAYFCLVLLMMLLLQHSVLLGASGVINSDLSILDLLLFKHPDILALLNLREEPHRIEISSLTVRLLLAALSGRYFIVLVH